MNTNILVILTNYRLVGVMYIRSVINEFIDNRECNQLVKKKKRLKVPDMEKGCCGRGLSEKIFTFVGSFFKLTKEMIVKSFKHSKYSNVLGLDA